MITRSISLFSFLNDLRDSKISYRLCHHREEAITVEIAVPGERWEVEFFEDGTVETEIFRSDGSMHGMSALEGLLRRNPG